MDNSTLKKKVKVELSDMHAHLIALKIKLYFKLPVHLKIQSQEFFFNNFYVTNIL